VRYPRPRFEAWRFCAEAKEMVLMWVGYSKFYKQKFRFYYEHCEYEGNGCDPELCLVGKKKWLKICNQRHELRRNRLFGPIVLRSDRRIVTN